MDLVKTKYKQKMQIYTLMFVMLLCVSTPGKLEKYAWPRWESNLRPLALEY